MKQTEQNTLNASFSGLYEAREGHPCPYIPAVLSLTTDKTLRCGDFVYHDGDAAERCFFLLEGSVELFKYDDLDRKRVHASLRAGDIFGIPELFESVYQLNAQCLSPCRIAILARSDFFEKAVRIEGFAIDLMKTMASLIALYQRSLSIQKAESRFYSYLYFLAKNAGPSSGTDILVAKPLRYEDMANILGLTRETVTRFIARLKNEGIISVTETHFRIEDISRLRDLSCCDEILSGYYGSSGRS
jgi:CRP/FNR family transcriptional regulator